MAGYHQQRAGPPPCAAPPPACCLNGQDASLCLQLLEGSTVASPPSTGPFGFAWSGVRGTIGVIGGRYRFSVTMLAVVSDVHLPVRPL